MAQRKPQPADEGPEVIDVERSRRLLIASIVRTFIAARALSRALALLMQRLEAHDENVTDTAAVRAALKRIESGREKLIPFENIAHEYGLGPPPSARKRESQQRRRAITSKRNKPKRKAAP